MPEMATCRCPNLSPDIPCTALATQEDLLCDSCRRDPDVAHGCMALGAWNSGEAAPHVRVDFPDGFFGSFSRQPGEYAPEPWFHLPRGT